LFQHYLQSQHQCLLLGQITQAQVSGWLEFLALVPTSSGSLRLPSTVESYARSARAFCQWSERRGYQQTTPFAHLALPRLETYELHPLAPQEWERLLLACRPTRKSNVLAEQATVRNRAILWLLFETGIRVSELCRLRLSDIDREQGLLLIRGKDKKARRLTLGQEGLYSLRMYLDSHCFGVGACRVERGAGEDHLFLSERGDPLTKNGMALLFARLRKRAGIARQGINPALLRKSFALRFLQTGGDPLILQELLGYSDQSISAHFRHLIAQVLARH
jgi:site-specific recombinase XerD